MWRVRIVEKVSLVNSLPFVGITFSFLNLDEETLLYTHGIIERIHTINKTYGPTSSASSSEDWHSVLLTFADSRAL